MSYDWDASTHPDAQAFKEAERLAREAFFDVVLARFGVTREEYDATLAEAGKASEAAYKAAAPKR
jgi:hypothetical protein